MFAAQSKMMFFCGLAFLACGIWSLIAPDTVALLLGLEAIDVGGTNEIRANYGGMLTGIGLFFLYFARKNEQRHAWLLVALLTGGLAAGRLLSMVADGLPGGVHLLALAVELFMALTALYFYTGRSSLMTASDGRVGNA